MAYLIVRKHGYGWTAEDNNILLTPEEAAAFLATHRRSYPSLADDMDIAEVILPPFAEAEKSAA